MTRARSQTRARGAARLTRRRRVHDQSPPLQTGGQSLLSFSTHNPLITFMSNGVPRVNNIKLDSKLELDSDLAKSCESFIMHATKVAVEPMLSFITKVTAVRVSSSASGKEIKSQAFASAARVQSIVAAVRTSLSTTLPALVRKLRLYVRSEKSFDLIVGPIRMNVTEAHDQMAALVDSEYDEGERRAIGMLAREELAPMLAFPPAQL